MPRGRRKLSPAGSGAIQDFRSERNVLVQRRTKIQGPRLVGAHLRKFGKIQSFEVRMCKRGQGKICRSRIFISIREPKELLKSNRKRTRVQSSNLEVKECTKKNLKVQPRSGLEYIFFFF